MEKTELTPSEIMPILRDQIRNNIVLAEKGLDPVTICIEGEAGIAKSAIVQETAAEFTDFYYKKLNVSELSVEDLLGFPFISFEMVKGDNTKWVPEKVLASFQLIGWEATGETRMDYAEPDWVKKAEGKRMVLNLDDFSRCSPLMANACMSLIQLQSFGTWSLVKGSSIILTTNPDDQDYLVLTEDKAQKTRRLKLYCKASVSDWAVWAIRNGIEQKFIDFLVHNSEIIEKVEKDANNADVLMGNLRSWTIFFNAISSYEDLKGNWTTILNLGSGSFPKEHLTLLYAFINDGLDRIPSPKDVLFTKDIVGTIGSLKALIKSREDIAALVTKRLYNEIVANPEALTPEAIDNYREIIDSEVLVQDILWVNIKRLTKLYGDSKEAMGKSMKFIAGLMKSKKVQAIFAPGQ